MDLFSKSLLLVPIHLEVHWCLVAADNMRKRICLYDSQGNALQKVARVTRHSNRFVRRLGFLWLFMNFFRLLLGFYQNVLKYLMTEARERKQTAFENGWTVSVDEVQYLSRRSGQRKASSQK